MRLKSVLVANRGEIACRVMRTARRMGIRTVAVYSEADRDSMHVAMADEAHAIGPAAARESYLRGDRIIAAAQASGAEAVHPGYGFLSENAEFAEACAVAGLTFIGPPPAAIRAMGSKSAAKALMERAGVPLVPGYHGEDQDSARLEVEATRIGYPVLIKASAGGGGKGMRVVEHQEDFASALELAKGEARAAFGDDQVLVERYLTRPRHIEIQVFADTHGNVVYLFERDCSIQRRHQKVVEEAPAPGMDPGRRAAMGRAACDAARAIGYVGAGTVEFIAEGDDFFFMEMNTRLQVEHPVTEMITGQDLVEWQLRVAAEERLPLLQDGLAIHGHAIEVRIYAEDPSRDFVPSVGRLAWLRQPDVGDRVRVDSGVREGDEITVHYDPMIAKLIAWGETRAEAIRRLSAALMSYEVVGVRTNLDLLRNISAHPAFQAANLDTGFIQRHSEVLKTADGAQMPRVAIAAVVAELLGAEAQAALARDPWSPWSTSGAWRLNGDGYRDLTLKGAEAEYVVRVHPDRDDSFDMVVDKQSVKVRRGAKGVLVIDGVTRRVPVAVAHGFTAIVDGVNWPLSVVDPLAPSAAEGTGGDRLLAPMPGMVILVSAEPGAAVKRGEVMLILEAMKIQMRLVAPRDAVVETVRARVGEQVQDGAELVRFAPAAAS
jgi:3-methylcrotonyl-CoA carboxylase alpha subunit